MSLMDQARATITIALRKIAAVYALAIWLIAASAMRCDISHAQSSSVREPRGDWQVRLETKDIKHFLDYKGCELNPVTSVKVFFSKRGTDSKWTGEQLYEDLWFHDGAAIGCRRYIDLPDIGGQTGELLIADTEDVEVQLRSVVNAVVRLMLDLGLRDSVVLDAVAPDNLYDECSEELSHMSFYETKSASAYDSMVMLKLVAVSRPTQKYFVFKAQDGGR